MTDSTETLTDLLSRELDGLADAYAEHCGQVTVTLGPDKLLAAGRVLVDKLGFRQLSDLAGIDYQTYGAADWQTNTASRSGFSRGVERTMPQPDERRGDIPARFAVVYHLLSLERNERVRLRVPLDDEPPLVPSVIDIWPSANWFEREAFDLFGILFEGHPDLRRLLTDYGFVGHPFRKDFPLEGHVEVRYDPDQGRVVYQPVSIEPRVLVPRVIREEAEKFAAQAADDGSSEELGNA
ncbi:MAG: NADH-quinone oxidoreductase subunit C [Gammaproteobacteria bacterium]|nr:NADH-quinone oxidoreductase subunit C [Gammaproteobacteria bacterium]